MKVNKETLPSNNAAHHERSNCGISEPEKSYSINEEEYYDLDSIMEALREDYSAGDEVVIFEGDALKGEHSDFINPRHLIEIFQESAYESYGEWADRYLDDLGADKTSQLKGLIARWLNENAKPITFFTVKNVQQITIKVED